MRRSPRLRTTISAGLLAAAVTLAASVASAALCSVDSDCFSTSSWCVIQDQFCLARLTNGTPMPVDPPHTNPTLNGTCTVQAANLVCVSGVCDTDNKCGYAGGGGPCNLGNGNVLCRSGACSMNGSCLPVVGGCNIDADCSSGQWCNENLHTCSPKLANGTPIPTDNGSHLDGTCSPASGSIVCLSGVCDLSDNECGLVNGSGPCTLANAATICRTASCNYALVCGVDMSFVPPDKETLKCESAAAKAAAKLWSAIAKCQGKAAAAALVAKSFDETACETTAATKFNTTTAALGGCPACLQGALLTAVRDLVEDTGEQNKTRLYCSGSTPLP